MVDFKRVYEPMQWEKTKEYDDAIKLIGKNKNYLLD